MADYELRVARYNAGNPFNTKNEALEYLDDFGRHKYGQFVVVRYYKGIWEDGTQKVQAILAMGVQDWDKQQPGTEIDGKKMYVVLSDSGEEGGGGDAGSGGGCYRLSGYYETRFDETLHTFTPETLIDPNLNSYIYNTIYKKVKEETGDDYELTDGDLAVLEVHYENETGPDTVLYVMYVFDKDTANWNPTTDQWIKTIFNTTITMNKQSYVVLNQNGRNETTTDPFLWRTIGYSS